MENSPFLRVEEGWFGHYSKSYKMVKHMTQTTLTGVVDSLSGVRPSKLNLQYLQDMLLISFPKICFVKTINRINISISMYIYKNSHCFTKYM